MKYDLVIFDCDGTLVDTEELSNGVVSEILTRDYALPQYDLARCMRDFVGRSLDRIVADIITETNISMSEEEMIFRYEQRLCDMIPAHIRTVEGVSETLPLVQGRIPMRVASNGVRSVVLASLFHAGLSLYFNERAVYTKDMVENGKPAPDLFLLAAQEAGVPPGRVIVIEDSVPGVRAGKAAGMTVIGLSAAYHDRIDQEKRLLEAEADDVTHSFRAIPRLIGL